MRDCAGKENHPLLQGNAKLCTEIVGMVINLHMHELCIPYSCLGCDSVSHHQVFAGQSPLFVLLLLKHLRGAITWAIYAFG
jgi:hypothetical protein